MVTYVVHPREREGIITLSLASAFLVIGVYLCSGFFCCILVVL